MSKEILLACGVRHSFASSGGPVVLDNAELSLATGEAIAITGVSGCGKSTLLHILGGLVRPDAGEVFLAGVSIANLSPAKLAKLRSKQLGFVYQMHHLLDEFSAVENVAVPLLVAGGNWKESLKRAEQLLESVDLAGQAKSLPAQMSGGERQRTAIARALANRPACVIADEPTGNLDRNSADKVIELLLSICAEQDTALLVATHDLDFANQTQRQLELRQGKLV